MKKLKYATINKKLKGLRNRLEVIRKSSATRKNAAAIKRDVEFTRNDLDQKFRRLALEIVKNSQDIQELKALRPAVEEVRENFWMMINRIDSLIRKLDVAA